ncbi:MAG: cytochrome c biogenesis protein CcsA [Nitrospiraceae bacterium]|nr:MAG: cytochrome c biogenesis protein CcsA [Nitrospiraceae bacterium]
MASILLLSGFIFNKDKLLKLAGYFVIPAFAAHTVIFVMRWAATGYFPANSEFENAITGGWFAIGFTVYLFIRNRALTGVALFTVPASLLFLGYGVMKAPDPLPLAASLKSSWLVIHVLFAQLAFGAYAIASGMGLLYLLKDRKMIGERMSSFYKKIPRLEVIEENMFRFVVYGFIADAIMIVAGAIWAKDLWGNYWGWDPVEVWSLISWLLYGLSIHLKVTLGWKGRRLAWLMIFLLITVIITYWGIDIVVENTRHIFGVTSLPDLMQ